MKRWCVPMKFSINVYVDADDADYAWEQVNDAGWVIKNANKLSQGDGDYEVGKPELDEVYDD